RTVQYNSDPKAAPDQFPILNSRVGFAANRPNRELPAVTESERGSWPLLQCMIAAFGVTFHDPGPLACNDDQKGFDASEQLHVQGSLYKCVQPYVSLYYSGKL